MIATQAPPEPRHRATLADLEPRPAPCRRCRAETPSVAFNPPRPRAVLDDLPLRLVDCLTPDELGVRQPECAACRFNRLAPWRKPLAYSNVGAAAILPSASAPSLMAVAAAKTNHPGEKLAEPGWFDHGVVLVTETAGVMLHTAGMLAAPKHLGNNRYLLMKFALDYFVGRHVAGLYGEFGEYAHPAIEDKPLGILAPRAARNSLAIRARSGDVFGRHEVYRAGTAETDDGPKDFGPGILTLWTLLAPGSTPLTVVASTTEQIAPLE